MLAALLASSAPCGAAPEGRALFVTRWYMKDSGQVADAVAYAAAHNFNMMFCQVLGDARALYSSAVTVRSPLVAPGFDALAEAVARGHAEGLEIHAYINTVNVWSGGLGVPPEPDHIINAHPEWSAENADGVRDVDLAASDGVFVSFCPREPAFVAFLVGIVEEIASGYDIDGIHLDYIRYLSDRHCFCPRHKTAFRARYGRDPEPGEGAFVRFCEDDVFALVERLNAAAKAIRPDCRLSASLINPSGRKGQDAQRWLEAGIIDIAVPMLYTADPAVFESSLAWFHERSGGRLLMPSIGAGYGAVGAQIDLARHVGAEGVALFDSDGVTSAITAELDARFGSPAPVPPCPWIDGSADGTRPVLSSVHAVPFGAQEATVMWHTDERADGTVQYGATAAYGNTATVGALVFEHSLTLGGLAPSTTYHFRVRSADAAGNASTSGDFTFTTGAEGANEIVVDDHDADMTMTGTWSKGSSAGGYGDDYYWTSDQTSPTARAEYRPYLPRSGDWEVAVTYVPGSNRVIDAPYTIEYAGDGSETVTVDQKTRPEEWIVLGTFPFEEGWGAAVILTNQSSGGDVVVADAISWRYVGLPPNPPFIRGDANADGAVNVADAITILGYLFASQKPKACMDALDVADNGKIDISHAIRLLGYLFARGTPPAAPFPSAGHDPTPTDAYTCGD